MTISPEIYTGLPPKQRTQFVFGHHYEKHEMIAMHVCNYFNIERVELSMPTRKRTVVTARQIAMTLIKENTKLPLTQIGKLFNRDHSTVIYAMEAVSDLCETDKKYKAQFNHIQSLIK